MLIPDFFPFPGDPFFIMSSPSRETSEPPPGGGGSMDSPSRSLRPPSLKHNRQKACGGRSVDSAGSSELQPPPLCVTFHAGGGVATHGQGHGGGGAAHSVPDMDVTELDLELPYRPLRSSFLQPGSSYDSGGSGGGSGSAQGGSRESVRSSAAAVAMGGSRPIRRSAGVIRQHSQPEPYLDATSLPPAATSGHHLTSPRAPLPYL